MRYAINVADLTYFGPPGIAGMLLGPLLSDPKVCVKAEKSRIDGDALVLNRAEPLRALCAIAVLQKKAQTTMPYPLRAYREGARGGWTKLPYYGNMTVEQLQDVLHKATP